MSKQGNFEEAGSSNEQTNTPKGQSNSTARTGILGAGLGGLVAGLATAYAGPIGAGMTASAGTVGAGFSTMGTGMTAAAGIVGAGFSAIPGALKGAALAAPGALKTAALGTAGAALSPAGLITIGVIDVAIPGVLASQWAAANISSAVYRAARSASQSLQERGALRKESKELQAANKEVSKNKKELESFIANEFTDQEKQAFKDFNAVLEKQSAIINKKGATSEEIQAAREEITKQSVALEGKIGEALTTDELRNAFGTFSNRVTQSIEKVNAVYHARADRNEQIAENNSLANEEGDRYLAKIANNGLSNTSRHYNDAILLPQLRGFYNVITVGGLLTKMAPDVGLEARFAKADSQKNQRQAERQEALVSAYYKAVSLLPSSMLSKETIASLNERTTVNSDRKSFKARVDERTKAIDNKKQKSWIQYVTGRKAGAEGLNK